MISAKNPVRIISNTSEITRLLHEGDNVVISMSADAVSDLEKFKCGTSLEWIELKVYLIR